MPRRPASQRHLDSAPRDVVAPSADIDPTADVDQVVIEPTVDALIAVAHPVRRRMFEVLVTEGPASVGALAGRLEMAVGSVSHHVKALHRNGFVVPAPECARDTRESWWRAVPARMSYSRHDFAPGTVARQVVELAARANIEHHQQLVSDAMQDVGQLGPEWERAGMIGDTMVSATREQLDALTATLDRAVRDWKAGCQADQQAHPDSHRVAVLVVNYAVPVRP